MYLMVRLTDRQFSMLKGLANHRNTSPNALAGSIVGMYLVGKLVYNSAKKSAVSTGISQGGGAEDSLL